MGSIIFPLIGREGYLYSFPNHCSMTNTYFWLYDFLSKHFGTTYISVCCPFPGPGYCNASLTEAAVSQAGHIERHTSPYIP